MIRMNKFQLTAQARQDLIQIRRFTLAYWGIEQSFVYLRDLKKTLQLLADMPTMGQQCIDVGENVYRFPFRSHMIYYLTTLASDIVIAAVLHQTMLPEKHLEKRL